MDLSHLNKEQQEAVQLQGQHAFILAGAGTGKTSVLTHRISWLLEQGVDISEVVAVTFTNKAAREMKERLGKMVKVSLKDAWIGTFHGICHKILRANYKLAGLPSSFTIIDEGEQLGVIKRAILSHNQELSKELCAEVQIFINKHKERGTRSKDVVIAPKDGRSRELNRWYAAYEKRCVQESVIDFAELMLRVYEMWNENPGFLKNFHDRFRYILVDEFQDTSTLQYNWLKLLTGKSSLIFAVGDDDQSIYGWRGAVVKNVSLLIKEYGAKLIKLEQNYRSTDAILNLANAVIGANDDRVGKTLRTPRKANELPIVRGMADQNEEAQFVCEKIKELYGQGVPYKEMAVLYRASALSRPFEHEFTKAGIKYVVYGGMRFYERQEVRHALAYLKLIAAPQDDGALLRVINMPPRGIGLTSVDKLQEHAKSIGKSNFDAIETLEIGGKAKQGLKDLKRVVDELRAENTGSAVADRLKTLLESTGLRQWYKDQIKAGKEPEERLENLDELVSAARGFEKEFPHGTMEDFLSITALESSSNKADKEDKEHVSIMTIHASKGLEFEAVFVAGVEQDIIPNARCLEPPLIQEERRLMYVAITRAKTWLTLCLCFQRMKYGDVGECEPSVFLKELTNPKKLLKYVGMPYLGRKLKLKD